MMDEQGPRYPPKGFKNIDFTMVIYWFCYVSLWPPRSPQEAPRGSRSLIPATPLPTPIPPTPRVPGVLPSPPTPRVPGVLPSPTRTRIASGGHEEGKRLWFTRLADIGGLDGCTYVYTYVERSAWSAHDDCRQDEGELLSERERELKERRQAVMSTSQPCRQARSRP